MSLLCRFWAFECQFTSFWCLVCVIFYVIIVSVLCHFSVVTSKQRRNGFFLRFRVHLGSGVATQNGEKLLRFLQNGQQEVAGRQLDVHRVKGQGVDEEISVEDRRSDERRGPEALLLGAELLFGVEDQFQVLALHNPLDHVRQRQPGSR